LEVRLHAVEARGPGDIDVAFSDMSRCGTVMAAAEPAIGNGGSPAASLKIVWGDE